MTEKEDAQLLLQKYVKGRCTPDERNLVDQWYNHMARENSQTPFSGDMIIREQAVLEQLWPSGAVNTSIILNTYRKYIGYGWAALILICMAAGLYLMVTARHETTFGGDADPGKNKAIITLTDGSRINVTDAKNGLVTSRSGIQIMKTGKGEVVFKFLPAAPVKTPDKFLLNTIETPDGGEYKVCLPDGSMVWLNAASTLKFSTNFMNDSKREVQLSGEAYFEVKKDLMHPFIVHSSGQQLRVLGTHFNVNSYADEPTIKTTLLEGSVMVNPDDRAKKPVLLSPHQEAVNTGSSIIVQDVDPENAVAWHKGRFAFNEEPLENIMRKISRWYGVTVVYQNNTVRYKNFGGSVSRYARVSEVLCLLELTKKVKFTIKGKEIIVMD